MEDAVLGGLGRNSRNAIIKGQNANSLQDRSLSKSVEKSVTGKPYNLYTRETSKVDGTGLNTEFVNSLTQEMLQTSHQLKRNS